MSETPIGDAVEAEMFDGTEYPQPGDEPVDDESGETAPEDELGEDPGEDGTEDENADTGEEESDDPGVPEPDDPFDITRAEPTP